jgi:hypothetical protein
MGATAAAQTAQIIVQVVDGKTGDPLPDHHLTVFAGDSADAVAHEKMHFQLLTNKDGRALLSVAPGTVKFIQVWPDDWVLCQTAAKATSFSVGAILSGGVEAEDTCGSLPQTAAAGKFVVYARRPTLKEKLRR